MAQEFRPGKIVPQSGIYTITHDPAHADVDPLAAMGGDLPIILLSFPLCTALTLCCDDWVGADRPYHQTRDDSRL